jgi:hypothetical protein
MAVRLSEKDKVALEQMFVDAKGRGFKPSNMRAAVISRALNAGWLRKADGDFFAHRERGSHVIFTDIGKANLLRRMADRHAMDVDDTHHLVRTGNYHLVTTSAVRGRCETVFDTAVQTGF